NSSLSVQLRLAGKVASHIRRYPGSIGCNATLETSSRQPTVGDKRSSSTNQ
ncbi:hypothetical protein RRG08_061686, partial [Elysia crispata]